MVSSNILQMENLLTALTNIHRHITSAKRKATGIELNRVGLAAFLCSLIDNLSYLIGKSLVVLGLFLK